MNVRMTLLIDIYVDFSLVNCIISPDSKLKSFLVSFCSMFLPNQLLNFIQRLSKLLIAVYN